MHGLLGIMHHKLHKLRRAGKKFPRGLHLKIVIAESWLENVLRLTTLSDIDSVINRSRATHCFVSRSDLYAHTHTDVHADVLGIAEKFCDEYPDMAHVPYRGTLLEQQACS